MQEAQHIDLRIVDFRMLYVLVLGVVRDEQSAKNWAATMNAQHPEERDDERVALTARVL